MEKVISLELPVIRKMEKVLRKMEKVLIDENYVAPKEDKEKE